mgnify:CR=1 FL=1
MIYPANFEQKVGFDRLREQVAALCTIRGGRERLCAEQFSTSQADVERRLALADEMRRLDLKNVRAENGRVHCEGTLADIARLNINLRCGARVLMELGSFPARDFEALFQGVYALPWEDYIPRDGEFPVKGYSLNSQLHSVPACQSIVKKASAKRLGEKYGVETLPESGSRYQIQFSII